MANKLLQLPGNRLFNNSNIASPGGTATLYLSGTSTLANFLDSGGVPLGATITANGLGQLPNAYGDETVAYRMILRDSAGVQIDGGDIDPFYFGRDNNLVTLAAGSSVDTRTLLSQIATPGANQSAILTESGREGTFVFSTADLSAEVAADTLQGIYVPPSSDTTGASGAWVRKFDGPIEVDWFGPDGIDDVVAIHAAKAVANAIGHLSIRLSPKTHVTGQALILDVPGLAVEAAGATLSSSIAVSGPTLSISGSDTTLRGLHVLMTANDGPYTQVGAPNCTIDGVTIEKPDGSGGIQLYIRNGSDGLRLKNSTIKGSNGIGFGESSNVEIIGNRFIGRSAGGDDAIAIKSINVPSVGWRIIGNYFENLVAFCSIGSEIGVRSDQTGTLYSRYVRDIVVMGNTGTNCKGIAYIKPGAVNMGVLAYDYRDGVVEGIVIKDNVLDDPLGSKFERAVAITPGRGAIVRDIVCKDNIVTGRTTDGTGRHAGVVDIYIIDSTGSPGDADATVSGVWVNGKFADPWNGVTNGTGGAPGYPIGNLVTVEKANAAYGIVSDITLEIDGNGTSASGIVVQQNLDDAVTFKRAHLTNINAGGSATFGGIQLRSRATVGTDVSIGLVAGQPYCFPTAGQGDIICPELTSQIYEGTLAAGSTPAAAFFVAGRRCQLIAIDGLVSADLASDGTNTNYTTLAFANLDLAGTNFATWSNRASGANGSNKRSGLTANVIASLYAYRDVTFSADRAQALLARDGRLKLTKLNLGTGGALNDLRLRVRAAPY